MSIAPWPWERSCSCQRSDVCWRCIQGDCGTCTGPLAPRPETFLTGADGLVVRPAVRVWLKDRTCRWACTCAAEGHPRMVAADWITVLTNDSVLPVDAPWPLRSSLKDWSDVVTGWADA